jgi:hypothetical protein
VKFRTIFFDQHGEFAHELDAMGPRKWALQLFEEIGPEGAGPATDKPWGTDDKLLWAGLAPDNSGETIYCHHNYRIGYSSVTLTESRL